MPLLNLTEYDEQQFDALPPGRYFAQVYECEERETGGGGKMPEGTPMIYVHFLITGKVGEDVGPNEDSPFYNRRAFLWMVMPPEDYDPKVRKSMNGRIVSFFKAIGVSEEEITSGTWEPDLDDFVERDLVIQLNRKPDKQDKTLLTNNVIGTRSMAEVLESETATADPGGLL